ncbi:hypothetical protein LCGC14_2101330 [marine sediment metagenome]|uniref:Uncharacterized protein n=1 Tax=marine sediment metagenome TaxID=412755 RepID=A0A0F9EX29_9ZZZZ
MKNDKQEQLIQTAIRLYESDLKLADKIAKHMSRPRFPVARAEVLRAAVAEGLKTLGAKYDKK